MTAFILLGFDITWVGLIIALSCFAAVLIGAILRRYQQKSLGGYLLCTVICAVFAILGSRLVYWYCNTGLYSGIAEVFTARDAGQSLGGAIIGALLGAVVFGIFSGFSKLPAMLDCLCVAGLAAISFGRLAGFFNTHDRGKMIFTHPLLQRFPFAVEFSVGGELTEWRFATFFWEAVACALIFVVCTVFFIYAYKYGQSKNEGKTALVVCALFGAVQAVLESTRFDSLFLHFNGFVSLIQMICLAMLLAAIVAAFCGYLPVAEKKSGAIFSLVLSVLLVGAAGALEYFVQRYAKYYPMWYLLMSAALGFAALLICRMLLRTVRANNAAANSEGVAEE